MRKRGVFGGTDKDFLIFLFFNLLADLDKGKVDLLLVAGASGLELTDWILVALRVFFKWHGV